MNLKATLVAASLALGMALAGSAHASTAGTTLSAGLLEET
jgi:hypothetical protein